MDTFEAVKMTLGKGLTDEQIEKIVGLATTKDFMGGDTIVRQFDKKSDLIIILDGKVLVKSFKGDLIAELGPGSSVGEISLIDDMPRSATVHSAHGTKAGLISSEQLGELLASDKEMEAQVLRNICQTLCSRLRVATIQLDGLMTAR